ncbi:MAG: GPP34 family phosphoprotein [Bacteroidales bacterium]|nr:GPP34 family phosphoprotein [Bacteroidales bacterium]
MTEKNFSISERFLITAHHPSKGGFLLSQVYLQYGLAGALLLDLTHRGLITITDKKLTLKPGRALPSQALNDVVSLMMESPKVRRTDYWIRKLANRFRTYKWRILDDLAEKKIVRIERRKFLGLIPYRLSFFTESYTRANLVRHLKGEILSGRSVSGESNALAGLVRACNMQRILATDRDEFRRIKERLKLVVSESPVSDVVAQTISQVQAAIIASVTTAVIASSSAGRH